MDDLELATDTRADGALVNVFTGMGVPGKDRSTATALSSRYLLTQSEVELLYLTGVPRRFVDAIPEEIFRHLPTILIGGDESSRSQSLITDFEEELKALKAHAAIAEAITLQRLYGGSVLVPLIDDGSSDPTEPLDLRRIRSIEGFAVLSRYECIPEDVNFLDYSKPSFYRISTSQRLTEDQASPTTDIVIHHSRVIRFDGLYLPWQMRSRNTGWGMSCIQLIWDAYKRYESAMSGLEDMIQDSDLFVHKMPGLFKRLAGGAGGEAAMRRRLEANAMARSTYGGMAIDMEEEVAFLSRALGNLAQATGPFVEELQAATGWPASILMGNSPGGIGKEGRFEERTWASIVEKWQSVYCREPITELFTLLLHAKTGTFKGRPPEKWEVEFPSIFTLTEDEQADIEQKHAATDTSYINAGVLDPLEVRESRFSGNEFGLEITLDKKVSKMKKELQAKQHESQLVAMEAQNQAAMGTGMPPEAGSAPGAPGSPATATQSQQAQGPDADPDLQNESDILDEIDRQEGAEVLNAPEPDPKRKRKVLDSCEAKGIRIQVTHQVDDIRAGHVIDWDGQRVDTASSPTYVIIGPDRTNDYKLYQAFFRSDSALIPGPYVTGFRTISLAASGVAKLYPSYPLGGLQDVPLSKLQTLRAGWGAY